MGHPTETPLWYQSCGDPVCSGYTGPFTDVPLCTTEVEGDPCPQMGQSCDPQSDCNALLQCDTEDPQAQTGGCPISRVRYKTDIHYLNEETRQVAAEALWATRLATWRYQWDPPTRRARLGFLIDDQSESPAVDADGEHVDLYGYTSLVVAALQAEHEARLAEQAATQKEIAALRAELAEIRAHQQMK